MNTSMNGKRIQDVLFPNSEVVSPREGVELTLSATHHGDHDEFWIVETTGGKETARINCRYVESIQWADE